MKSQRLNTRLRQLNSTEGRSLLYLMGICFRRMIQTMMKLGRWLMAKLSLLNLLKIKQILLISFKKNLKKLRLRLKKRGKVKSRNSNLNLINSFLLWNLKPLQYLTRYLLLQWYKKHLLQPRQSTAKQRLWQKKHQVRWRQN